MTDPAKGQDQDQDQDRAAPKAEHGASSEVTWNDGRGHEPYSNQGPAPAEQAHGGEEFPEGDRGAASGRNLEQLEAVKGRP